MARRTTATTKRPAAADEERPETLEQRGDRWVLTPGSHPRDNPAGVVPALDKAIQALSFINAAAGYVTLAEIADATGIGRSHCHAILKTLAHHGWLAFEPQRRAYRLHAGILRDLSSIMGEFTSPRHIRPTLLRLSEEAGVSCILSQPLPDGSFLVVDKMSAPAQLEISYPIGHRFPPDASAQMKANLAWRPQTEIEAWLKAWKPVRYTPYSIMTEAELRDALEAVRRRGYARSVGEFTEGLMALALPIFDARGRVVFVFDCIGVIPVMREREDEIAAAMIRTAAEIHRLVGGVPPADRAA